MNTFEKIIKVNKKVELENQFNLNYWVSDLNQLTGKETKVNTNWL